MRSLLRVSPMGVLLIGEDHTIRELNEPALELLGYSREELIGQHPQLFHPGHDAFERTLGSSGSGSCSAETLCILKDGRPLTLKLTAALIDPDAPGCGYALTLLKSAFGDPVDEPFFARIFDQIPDAVGLTRATDNTFAEINQAFEDLFGYSREELIGHTSLELGLWEHPEDHDHLVAAVKDTPLVRGLEFRMRKKDGHSFIAAFTAREIKQDGKTLRLVILNDTTEHRNIENALRESEAHLEAAQAHAHMGSWTLDLGLNRDFWSKQMYRLFDLEPAPFPPTFQDYLELVHPDDRATVTEAFQLSVQTGVTTTREYRTNPARCTPRVLENTVCADCDAQGKPLHLSGTIQDITERKHIENALRESEAHLEAAQSHAHIGSWTLDLGLDQGFWSKENYRLFDLKPSPHPPCFRDYLELVHPSDRTAVEDGFRQVVQSGLATTMEYRTNPAKCSPRVLEIAICAETDDHGKPLGLSGTIQDITERKRIENALRESEKRTKLLLENSNDLFLIIDAEGNFKEAMGPVKTILGYEPQELIGQNGLDNIHPQDLPQAAAILRDAIANPGIAYRSEYRYRHKDGSWIPFETVGVNWIQDPDIQGVILNCRDVGQRKAAEASLRLSEMRLEAAQAQAGIGSWEFDPTT
ncbi:MAG TPA: PAS domain S-box protein, partial [Holophaga sp.]|nr:PAS domain S-box protein [Holophaga sp.]